MNKLTGKKIYHALVGSLVAGFLATPLTSTADAYPSRPIRLVVGFSAGGTTDILARLLATHMAKFLGQPIIIDNKPGASGTIAANFVAKAPADGYTVMLTTSTVHGVGPSLFKKLPYDTNKSFEAVSLISRSTMVLVTNNDFPARTVSEVIAAAKDSPGGVSYGSAGPGSTFHLVAALFSRQAGIEMLHVPYKGGGAAMPAIMSGEINMAFDNIASTRSLIDGKRLRAVAVTSAKRSPSLPDIPTFVEAGLPGFTLFSWSGLVAPAGTPGDVIRKLNDAANRALQSEEMRDALQKGDTEPQGGTPEAFTEFMYVEQKKWGDAVRLTGVAQD